VLFGRHIVELNGTNGAVVRSYVWGLDLSESLDGAGGVGGLLWVRLSGGAAAGVHFVTYDGNGNVWTLVSASTGTETARYEYGPFGEPLRLTGAAAASNPFRFSTKRTEDGTGLVLYEMRVYVPSLGRWPNGDPIGERGGRNLYGFVRNNPLGRIDRLGLSDRNSPSGNLEIPFEAQPCGNATAIVDSGYAEVRARVSIKIIVIAPGEGGQPKDGEIGPFPIGTRWVPMSDNEPPNVACRMKYKCTMQCCCAFGNFSPVWKGKREWVLGRVFSKMKINPWTGQQERDREGNWVWEKAKCEIDTEQLENANKDCRDTSKGKCKITIQLKSYYIMNVRTIVSAVVAFFLVAVALVCGRLKKNEYTLANWPDGENERYAIEVARPKVSYVVIPDVRALQTENHLIVGKAYWKYLDGFFTNPSGLPITNEVWFVLDKHKSYPKCYAFLSTKKESWIAWCISHNVTTNIVDIEQFVSLRSCLGGGGVPPL
jgi:RHS repeat-associated protein